MKEAYSQLSPLASEKIDNKVKTLMLEIRGSDLQQPRRFVAFYRTIYRIYIFQDQNTLHLTKYHRISILWSISEEGHCPEPASV